MLSASGGSSRMGVMNAPTDLGKQGLSLRCVSWFVSGGLVVAFACSCGALAVIMSNCMTAQVTLPD